MCFFPQPINLKKSFHFFIQKMSYKWSKMIKTSFPPWIVPRFSSPTAASGVFNVYYGRQEEILRLGQLGLDLGTSAPAERWSHEKMVIFWKFMVILLGFHVILVRCSWSFSGILVGFKWDFSLILMVDFNGVLMTFTHERNRDFTGIHGI